MSEEKLVLRNPEEVVIRMYGQGFGDCFLLAFPRIKPHGGELDLNNPVYVVIDSGVFFLTPDQAKRMRSVTRSIKEATGGTVDLLVVTHEHHDHVCGFEYARADWKKIAVRRIWLAWTEDPDHPATQRYDREKETLERQAEAAVRVAEARQEEDPNLALALAHTLSLSLFLGEDISPDTLSADDDGSAIQKPPRRVSKSPHLILSDLAHNPGKRFKPGEPQTEREFCEPGQVRAVEGTAVDAYVLGPPTDEALLGLDTLESEIYPTGSGDDEAGQGLTRQSWQRFALAAASSRAERLSLGSALERHAKLAAEDEGSAPASDENVPFRPAVSISYSTAAQDTFFQEHYFKADPARQIETDWLYNLGRLALQLDNLTNNTSLALAFRLPDGRVLLFVGDAQVGNWLSWQQIEPKDWRRPDGGQVNCRPRVAELLAQTVVYKVGHHGSHNATLKTKGLELMQDGLIAFVPVSRYIPQSEREPDWKIPLPALLERLREKSGGRVILPYDDHDYISAGFAAQVEAAEEMLPAMKRKDETGQNKTIEPPVPLWRQVRI